MRGHRERGARRQHAGEARGQVDRAVGRRHGRRGDQPAQRDLLLPGEAGELDGGRVDAVAGELVAAPADEGEHLQHAVVDVAGEALALGRRGLAGGGGAQLLDRAAHRVGRQPDGEPGDEQQLGVEEQVGVERRGAPRTGRRG